MTSRKLPGAILLEDLGLPFGCETGICLAGIALPLNSIDVQTSIDCKIFYARILERDMMICWSDINRAFRGMNVEIAQGLGVLLG